MGKRRPKTNVEITSLLPGRTEYVVLRTLARKVLTGFVVPSFVYCVI